MMCREVHEGSGIRGFRARTPGVLAAALLTVGTWLILTEGQPSPVLASAIPTTEDGSLATVTIDPPAPPGSIYPALAAEGATTVSKGHEVLVTWLDKGDTGDRLRFSRLSSEGWSPPVTIANNVVAPGPTDRPSLTVIGTQSVRRTLIARLGDTVARSGDAGRTWGRLPSPTLPFSSFAAGEEGAYVFWLDDSEERSTRLLGTRLLAGRSVLDPTVAGGAGTSAAMTWDGPVVVYRDEIESGAQDISIVRRENARWTPPTSVSGEGWSPARGAAGGPCVSARERQLAVAWYSEASTRPRVLVSFSDDAGRTFGDPIEVASAKGGHMPLEALDVVLDENGEAIVLWAATNSPSEARLHLARVAGDGEPGDDVVVARGLSANWRGIPQITLAGPRVAVAWSEGAPSRVRTVAVPLAAVPSSRRASAGSQSGADGSASTIDTGRGKVGELVPSRDVVDLFGNTVSPESLRGQPILLNLWATWCLPCIKEMPELAELHRRYGSKGLKVVGLSIDSAQTLDKVHAFVLEHRVPFNIWLDPEMQLFGALHAKAVPATFVVDREGRIVLRRDQGIAAEDPELIRILDRLFESSNNS